MRASPLSVLLVDDHAVVRAGYRRLLECQEGMEVVAEAEDASAAYTEYKRHLPSVVVMDVMLKGASGIDAVRRIIALDPVAHILMFSMYSHTVMVRQALEAGALGWLTKESPPESLISAVATVARGRHCLTPQIAEALALDRLRPTERQFESLSPREFEVCRLLLAGHRVERIASQLNLSPKTVANRLSAVRQKLDVGSDVELVMLAAGAGLLPWSLQEKL